jgi:hypothetical protein
MLSVFTVLRVSDRLCTGLLFSEQGYRGNV